jgi:hypothetical protein
MTEEPTPTPVEEAVAEEQPTNLLEQLAAKRQEISENREVDIPVPGYDMEPPLLLIRYKLLDGHALTQIGRRIRSQGGGDQFSRALNAAVDTFVAACVGMYVDLGDGQPTPLTYQGEHLKGFTIELAEALQFADKLPENATSRHVAMGLFGGNDVAITQHSFVLNRWFQNTSLDVNQEFFAGGNL